MTETVSILKSRYQPGIGVPITRRNIADYNAERARDGLNAATTEEILDAFVPWRGARGARPEKPFKRHVDRISRLR